MFDNKNLDLRNMRVYRGYSQQELAEKSGVSLATINLIENTNYRPKYPLAKKLADALDVEVSKIFR